MKEKRKCNDENTSQENCLSKKIKKEKIYILFMFQKIGAFFFCRKNERQS